MRSADVVTRSIRLDPWDPSLTYPIDLSHDGWNWLYDDNTTATLDFPVVRYISDFLRMRLVSPIYNTPTGSALKPLTLILLNINRITTANP